MTRFTFLHAADLHLGSPFQGLALKDEEVARRFAAASREAFAALIEAALAEKVAFVVIAGDIYDGEWKDTSIGLFFARELSRLRRAGVEVFILRGNHDAESVVTKSITLPDGVNEFPSRAAKSFRLEAQRVVLHGRSFPDRSVAENYALTYPPAVPGWFNIGVLHTSCTGRPPHAAYAPCTPEDLARLGYQYWALGHVHDYEVVCDDPHIVYPGNIQGRSIRETGAKGAVIVEVEDGGVASLRRLLVDKARWARVAIDLAGMDTEEAALARIEEALREEADAAEERLLAVRVELAGATSLHRRLMSEPQWLRDEVQAAAHRCHEDIWIEDVVVRTAEPEGRRADRRALGLIDPAALLAGLEQDAEFRSQAKAMLELISAKLPAGIEDGAPKLADDLDRLLEEAGALVLGRLDTSED